MDYKFLFTASIHQLNPKSTPTPTTFFLCIVLLVLVCCLFCVFLRLGVWSVNCGHGLKWHWPPRCTAWTPRASKEAERKKATHVCQEHQNNINSSFLEHFFKKISHGTCRLCWLLLAFSIPGGSPCGQGIWSRPQIESNPPEWRWKSSVSFFFEFFFVNVLLWTHGKVFYDSL